MESQETGQLLSRRGAVHREEHPEDTSDNDSRSFAQNLRDTFEPGGGAGESGDTRPTQALLVRNSCAKWVWICCYVYALSCFFGAVVIDPSSLGAAGGAQCVTRNETCGSYAQCCDAAQHCVSGRCAACPRVGADCVWDGDCCPLERVSPTVCSRNGTCTEVLQPPRGWTYDFHYTAGWATCGTSCELDRTVDECAAGAGGTVLSRDREYRGPFVRAGLFRDRCCLIADEDICGIAFLQARPDDEVAILRRVQRGDPGGRA